MRLLDWRFILQRQDAVGRAALFRGWWFALAVGASWLGVCGLARAQPKPSADKSTRNLVALLYVRERGAESCPAESGLRDAVVSRLGYDPFRQEATAIVTVKAAPSGRGLRADIERRDGAEHVSGRQSLSSNASDCVELARAMALALSVAIDPLAAQAEPAPPASPEPVRPPVATPVDLAPKREPAVARASRSGSVEYRVGLGGLWAFHVVPGASLGLSAFVQGLKRPWALEVEGRAVLPASVEAQRGGTVTGSAGFATIAPCVVPGAWYTCVLLTSGVVRGSGGGFDHNRSDVTYYLGAGARLGAETQLSSRVLVRAQADVTATIRPTRFEVQEREVWATPRLSVTVGAQLGWRIP